jgi:hypothetical protein
MIVSSERFETVKPMDNASEAILALKPVTFHYKKDLDPAGIPQFGLVAEDVKRKSRSGGARQARQAGTVRYEAVNAMLLNGSQKHRMVGELKEEITALTATVKEQAAQPKR